MRTSNSIKNITVSLSGQIINMLVSFISRTIFINQLGANYLGINGVFSNILSVLSLAELGIGSAIMYSLYEPLAKNDFEKINGLMNLYKIWYRRIGMVILGLGILIIPFMKFIIKDINDIPNIITIYILFLLNSVISYLFSYSKTLIIADQRSYITTIYTNISYVILNIVQILILIYTKSYILFLVAQILKTFIEDILVYYRVKKIYPFFSNKKVSKLNQKDIKNIVKNIKAMIYHKVGGVIVSGTDNVIISSIIGVSSVGLYSNYCLIINAIGVIINQIFVSITASVGNLNILETKEKSYDIFKKIFFFNFWISGFCSIALFILLNNFICLWLGERYVFSISVVFIIVINFYMSTIRSTAKVYKDSLGLFWNDRYKPIIEGIINIVVSIAFARKLGIIGVFLGTLISNIATTFWVEPYVVYKHIFNINLKEYFYQWLKYIISTLAVGFITYKINLIFNEVTYFNFFISFILCMIIPNILFILIFYKNREFKFFKNLIRSKIKNRAINE